MACRFTFLSRIGASPFNIIYGRIPKLANEYETSINSDTEQPAIQKLE